MTYKTDGDTESALEPQVEIMVLYRQVGDLVVSIREESKIGMLRSYDKSVEVVTVLNVFFAVFRIQSWRYL